MERWDGIENRIDTKDHLGEEVEYKDFNKISVLMPNIDFGVTFRPENFMEITKKIKNITLITASGEKLIDIEYNMDGTIKSEIGGHNVQGINNTNNVEKKVYKFFEKMLKKVLNFCFKIIYPWSRFKLS